MASSDYTAESSTQAVAAAHEAEPTPQEQVPPTLDDERDLIAQRRAAINASPDGVAGPNPAPVNPEGPLAALALSGGGIRSATFALGVLQAVAETRLKPDPNAPVPADGPGTTFRRSLLSHFDYLSTVSGGGYVGAFLAALFMPGRLRDKKTHTVADAADDATLALGSGPPGRMRASDPFTGAAITRAPLAWLRENGRYLMPSGTGDGLYAGALVIRNWFALHYVIGTVLLAVLTLVAFARYFMNMWIGSGLEQAALSAVDGATLFRSVWWSPVFVLALILLLVAALPFGLAYWLSYDSKDGKSHPLNIAVAGTFVICVMLAAASLMDALPRAGLWGGAALVMALGLVFYMWHARNSPPTAENRAHLTQKLASALFLVLVVGTVALIDTIGQTLYLWSLTPYAVRTVAVPTVLVAVLVWLTKKSASFGKKKFISIFAKLPLTTLAGMAGMVIFLGVAGLWSFALNWLIRNGVVPEVTSPFGEGAGAFLGCLLAAILLLTMVTGQFPGFINLSSLQTFYGARITRAYLGASNKVRFEKTVSVSEPLSGDNLKIEDFYDGANKRLTTFAPLHIVNVTLNKTVDPAEQLVQRDRKGQPLAVMPYGFSVDGWMRNFRQAGVTSFETEASRPLSLGQWIGTSGAAFSTGIGRETTLGMSLLMGMANVRLGVWWESGVGVAAPPSLAGMLFRTQSYLSYEFRAQFFGLRRKWQYLSDGGHFENTALYELLRPARNIRFIIASDNGADADYRFDDLANLIRLLRIDMNVDLAVITRFGNLPLMTSAFGAPADFLPASGAKGAAARNPGAMLLRARTPDHPDKWIMLIKPSVPLDAPADIQQYKRSNPDFPQQTTTDQFFDEAQWESYRSLGYCIASKLLTKGLFDELRQFADNGGEPVTAPNAGALANCGIPELA